MKKILWLLICFLLVSCQQDTIEVKTVSIREKAESYALSDEADLDEMITYLGHFHQLQNSFNPSVKIRNSQDEDADLEALKNVKTEMDKVMIETNDLIEDLMVLDTDIVLTDNQLDEARQVLKSLRKSFDSHRIDVKGVVDSEEAYISLLTDFYSIRLDYYETCLDVLKSFKDIVNEAL
ncbi:hypothetical protein EZV73_05820 [Acidaminobacter sp. JC074]|uniref:hypothetical protein n=1 Tax=Acidaminobacter sp. JC074 TaxID=2530199 RepID=UPI001F0CF41B|nr:hypothetical protein [Acidaminobacter sp. JC074]MCH4887076.1 hypothetical protein [Acidaminobacter sp. JC074]